MANYRVIDAFGSIITIQSSTFGSEERQIVGASIIGALPTSPSGNQSVSGTVNIGNIAQSIFGASVIGTVPTTQAGTRITSIAGTVALSPSIFGASIIGAVPVTGAFGSPSAIGYARRNDTLASTLGADGTFGPVTRDSAGRYVIKPFAADDSATFQVSASVVSTSVTLLRSSATGMRQYVTDISLANTGGTTTRVTLRDGSTSILAHMIAPTGGGAVMPGISLPFKTAPSQDLAFQGVTATSVLYISVRGYEAP